jgi:hypothetical protein
VCSYPLIFIYLFHFHFIPLLTQTSDVALPPSLLCQVELKLLVQGGNIFNKKKKGGQTLISRVYFIRIYIKNYFLGTTLWLGGPKP